MHLRNLDKTLVEVIFSALLVICRKDYQREAHMERNRSHWYRGWGLKRPFLVI